MGELRIESVSKTYSEGAEAVEALRDISLVVEDKAFVAIVGPSGCGKTTLLRILDGLLEPTSGEFFIDGNRVDGSGQDRGMVFQSFNLFPWRTVLGNVTFGLEAGGMGREVRNEIGMKYIELVGLDGFEDAYTRELSGGMQQRVGLARALSIDPEILLMDEPFGALDAQTRELMQIELLKIWSENQKTSVFITHDIEEAVFLSDRVIVLTERPGQIKEIVDIPFERPRYDQDLKESSEFQNLRHHIWDLLMTEQQVKEVPQ